MAERLLDAGHDLVVWNRTPARAAAVVDRGAQLAATPAAAARDAEVVITMLADPDALAAVTEGTDGVLAGVAAGTTVVEMSTVGPKAIERLATALPQGVPLVDAPVLGSLGEVEAGSLRVFAGGADEDVARVLPVLRVFGEPLHVGPSGAGAAAKLVANSTLFGTLAVFGEALILARALGLSSDAMFEVLAATPVAGQAERRRAAIESGEFPVRFPLRLALKDAELVGEAARDAGVELPLARGERERLEAALRAGLGDRDYSEILAWMLECAKP
jgi:3-hydroxyisobutyrate dehydrogenase/2-hydroxy-3-oxopropionate reductase